MSSHVVSAIEGVALSPQQARIWRLQNETHKRNLRTRFSIEIGGPLDFARLQDAWREVQERHQIVRTKFEYLPGIKDPLQVVQPEGTAIRNGVTPSSVNGLFRAQLFSAMEAGKDQGLADEVIATLYKVNEQQHVLAFSLPALLADGETARIIFSELCRCYGSDGTSEAAEIIQYTQFSDWYNELISGEEIEDSRAYWRRRDGHPATEFPLSGKRDAAPASASMLPVSLTETQQSDLGQVADRLGVTVSDFLFACWGALLHRFTGQSPVTFGALIDGRKYEELDAMPGLVGRYLPVTCEIDNESTFRATLDRLVTEKKNVGDNQEGFPFSADAPVSLPVAFESYTLPPQIRVDGVVFSLDGISAEVDHSDLVLCCNQHEHGVKLSIRFDSAVYEPAYVTRIAESFQVLAHAAARQPESRIAALPLLDEQKFMGWVNQLNDTRRPLADAGLVHDIIAGTAAKHWNEVAVEGHGIGVTYGRVQTEADDLASHLRGLGIGPESVVGIMMEHSPELMIAILGVLQSGAAYLPIDPTLPRERIAYMLEDSHARLLLTKESVASSLPARHPRLLSLKLDLEAPVAPARAVQKTGVHVSPENLAYLIYTSGSTGAPKASMITHRGLSNYIAWAIEAYAIREGTGAPLHSSIGFDLTVTSLFGPLMTGKTVVLSGMETLADCLRSHNEFSVLKVTPAHARMLGMQLPSGEARNKARYLILGGEALRPGDIAFWRDHAPETILINEYGPTETVVGCCVYQVAAPLSGSEAVPIGRPIANTQIYLLDELLRPVPVGVTGELYIAGEGLARGYLGRPDLTAERFLPHPFSVEQGARLYRTGDLGRYLPDGTIDCLGRTDHQVKIRGYRVELGEVESVLAKLTAVDQACVIARNTDRGMQLVAYLVGTVHDDRQTPVSVSEIREHLSGYLPDYMVPAAYVWLKELPLTANGKVDRKALPSPDSAGAEAGQYTEARTLEEELLCGIWSQVLSIERVGIDDNYFALGGDSIRSLQIITRAAERGLKFTVGDIFRFQTIRTLAQNLELLKAAPEVSAGPFSLITEEDRRLLPADAEAAYPLTRLQAGMVYHRELHPGTAVYHDIGTFHLRTPLKEELVTEAIRQLVVRHPALRTSFDLVTYSQPLQVVHREAPVPLAIDDLTHLDAAGQAAALREWAEADKRRGFDVTQYPLVRFQVHRRSAETFQFTLCFHHAILDGWSDASMLTEIAERYFYLLRGETYPTPPPETQFRDFVLLERQAIASAEHRRFWQERLEGSEFLSVPRWKPTPITARRGVGFHEVEISDELSNALKRLALAAAVPVKTVLLAAHMRALAMLSGKTDVTTFLTSVGRPETRDGDRVLGLFLNSTPFRLKLSGGKWGALLEEAFAVEREAVAFRRFPLAEIQKLLGREQVSETGFYFTHYHIYHGLEQYPDFQLLEHNYYEETNITLLANFALASFTNKVRFYLTSDQTEIGEEQLAAIAGYYHRVLIEMASHPEGRYDLSSLLSESEYEAAVTIAGESFQPEHHLCIHEQFSRQAALVPKAAAVVDDHQTLSYEQLERRSNQLAQRLKSLGVREEVVVGLLMERSVDLAVSVLGVLKAGGAYLPLDPSYPKERLAFILRDASAGVIITQEKFREQFAGLATHPLYIDSKQEPLSALSDKPVKTSANLDTLAYVIYTSGSTGLPKGVMITHRSLANYLSWCMKNYLPTDGKGSLVHSSISFDLTVTATLAPLVAGQPVTMVSDAGGLDALADSLVRGRDLSFVKLTPIHLRMLRDQIPDENLPGHTRSLIIGGEALHNEDVQRWQKAAPECVLMNEYGPTEATVGCSVFRVPAGTLAPGTGDVSIGKPIINTTLYILDEFLQPAPLMTPGELYIGGAGLARGYLARPDLTAEKFVPDPFAKAPGERLYRTGDLARVLTDGNLDFLGRRDSQVKIRGYRIETGEIESVLKAHPEVAQAVVLPRTFRNADQRLVAWVVPATSKIDLDDLRSFLQRKLPDYMVPALFVPLEKLPLTRNGKLDRAALPDPEMSRVAGLAEFVAPRTTEEQILAGVWGRVLGLERVGIDDDYFALGGDSIRSIQIVSLSRERGLLFSLQQLFQYPSVRRLAEALRDQQIRSVEPSGTQPLSLISAEDRALLPADVEDAYPLGRLQAGMIYHRELHPEAAIYHDVMSFHVKAPLRLELLQQAIEQLCARHPALRTSFDLSRYTEPLQLVHRSVPLPLEVEDLRGLDSEAQDAAIAAWIESDKARGFDIAQPPLIRFHIHRRSDETLQFTLCFHHAILDGWSDASLQMEIAQSYMFLLHGEAPPFSAPQTFYRDFIAMEQEVVRSREAREFWLKKVDGAKPIVLPRKPSTNGLPPRRGVFRVDVPVSAALSDQLHKLALSLAVPVKTILLSSHLAALSRISGNSDVLTCVTSNGRPETVDGDQVLGLFLNSTPFRLSLEQGRWSDLIKNTFNCEREILPFRRYPLAQIQQLCGGQRLSETGFYFTHYHIYNQLQRFGELEVLGIHAYEESSFTMVAMFGIDAFTNRVTLQLSCDQTQVEPAYAELMASWYEQALREMAANTEAELEFLRQASGQEPVPVSGNGIVTAAAARRKERPFSAPQSPLEEELAAMWCQVLAVPRVGRDDNFFELGGHSLLASQLISRVRAKYKIALPIRELMSAPTVSDLANAVQTAIWATQVQHNAGENLDKEEFIV